jgi:HAD superfamily hydrolase (TIGR01509 family)
MMRPGFSDPLPHLRAVLFDLDGTLLDSLSSQYAVFSRVFGQLGMRFDEAVYRAHYSPNWYLLYERMGVPRNRWPEADRLWLENYALESPQAMPGAEEVIAAARDGARAVGLVTSGDRSRVERDLARAGWERTFDVVICGGDVVERKPQPGPLLHALDRLGAGAGEAVYIGDTIDDVAMGKAAGTLTIGVATGFSSWEALADAAPAYLCRSLPEVVPLLLRDAHSGG